MDGASSNGFSELDIEDHVSFKAFAFTVLVSWSSSLTKCEMKIAGCVYRCVKQHYWKGVIMVVDGARVVDSSVSPGYRAYHSDRRTALGCSKPYRHNCNLSMVSICSSLEDFALAAVGLHASGLALRALTPRTAKVCIRCRLGARC